MQRVLSGWPCLRMRRWLPPIAGQSTSGCVAIALVNSSRLSTPFLSSSIDWKRVRSSASLAGGIENAMTCRGSSRGGRRREETRPSRCEGDVSGRRGGRGETGAVTRTCSATLAISSATSKASKASTISECFASIAPVQGRRGEERKEERNEERRDRNEE